MLIPLRCDAPLYHGPWGTIGVMALCLLLHPSVGSSDAVEAWILVYGEWNPLAWLSSAVVHEGWLHLIGNLVFFWVFGLIVEGKIGWWRFLALLAGIAMLSGAVEQTVMLGSEGGSLGLSGVIFGLIAIAWIWAPENEVDVLLLLFPFIRHFDLQVKTLGTIYIALEVLGAALDGFDMGTPMLHLLGAAVGLPIGIIMLRKGWVDCEGWDWFSRRRGVVKPARIVVPATPAPPPVDVTACLQRGDHDAAFTAWSLQRSVTPTVTAFRLAVVLVERQRWQDADAVVAAVLRSEPSHLQARLLQAWVLVKLGRPTTALEQLESLSPSDESGMRKLAAIRREAERLKAEQPYELA